MAQFSIVPTTLGTPVKAGQLLESVAIVNQTADSTAVSKAFFVPQWARTCQIQLNITVMAGTTPLLDFTVEGVDPWTLDTTHNHTLKQWSGIERQTSVSTSTIINIYIGTNVNPLGDVLTGIANADWDYFLNVPLPPVLVYTYTTDGTTDDEDYTFSISAFFRD